MGRGDVTEAPAALVLVHGAGSGPWVFDGWDDAFAGVELAAVDLHAGLDVSQATHEDYACAVVSAARVLPAPVALCGWSMGGLAVLQAAERVQACDVILLEGAPPAEAQGFDESISPVPGLFDPEEVYGAFPPGMRARPESLLARLERKRGLSVPSLPCRSLVVTGDEYREERGAVVAEVYGSELIDFPGLSHWDLVRSPAVRAAVARFLRVSA